LLPFISEEQQHKIFLFFHCPIDGGHTTFILFPVFGGVMPTAKIQTVKGLRVEIFSRPLRKNTTRPLTGWIGWRNAHRFGQVIMV